MSPWAIFAEEERRQIVTLFNRRRYAAVVEIIDALAQKTIPAQIGGYLQFVRQAAIAFMRWDQFEIKSALEEIHKANDLLAAHIRFFPASDLEDFRQHLDCLEKCLQAILSQTRGLKEPHRVLVDDLLNNARRKMADKRNDDAAARIYRALELYGQICFRELTGCTNDKVQPGMVPQELREEFVSKYRDPASDLLKLPLQATFRFLKCNGHEAGKRFYSYLKEIKNIQSNRNESILAHGLNPVSDKAVESIFKTVAEFIEFKEIYDFPRLP
jgi:CRISPR-associated protein (TIGR02710 family)